MEQNRQLDFTVRDGAPRLPQVLLRHVRPQEVRHNEAIDLDDGHL